MKAIKMKRPPESWRCPEGIYLFQEAIFCLRREGHKGRHQARGSLCEWRLSWNSLKCPERGNKPSPGSNATIEKGCICPLIDNRHGMGEFDLPDGEFWVKPDCPLHGRKEILK